MPGKDLEIRCPDCGTRIRLDRETGVVIAHGPGEKPKDLSEAARRHEERQGDREGAFRAAMDAEKGRKAELDDLFKKAADKASKSDPKARPDGDNDDRWR